MTDSLNTPDSNDTPGPDLTPTGQPLTPEIVTPVTPMTSEGFGQENSGGAFRVGFALLLLAGFAVATVVAFNYSVNSVVDDTPVNAVVSDTPLNDPIVELLNSPLNGLETPVITDEGTLVIPVTEDSVLEIPLNIEIPFDAQPGDVIDIPLPDGGIVIPPGGAVRFELQSTEGPLQGDGEIVVELTDDGATITDTEGNVTQQDKDGNVVTPTVVDPPASK